MKPGPATSTRRLAAEVGSGDDLVGDIARVAAQLLGEGERAVGLGVGSIARPHHRIDRDIRARHGSKRRCKQLGDDDEGISHERSIVPVRHSFDMPDSAVPAWAEEVRRYPR